MFEWFTSGELFKYRNAFSFVTAKASKVRALYHYGEGHTECHGHADLCHHPCRSQASAKAGDETKPRFRNGGIEKHDAGDEGWCRSQGEAGFIRLGGRQDKTEDRRIDHHRDGDKCEYAAGNTANLSLWSQTRSFCKYHPVPA